MLKDFFGQVGGWVGGWLGGMMNSRIRQTSAKVEVGVEVEAELGKNEETASYGWWSMAGGMSVNHMSVLPTWKEFFSARLGRDMYLISQGQGESGRQKQL